MFTVSNGTFHDSSGAPFFPVGVNSGSEQIGTLTAAKLRKVWPGINIVRMPCGNYDATPQALSSFVADMTANGIVTLIEHHPWPIPYALGGNELKAESDWYASHAAAFKDNAYVWFGTMNEPQGGDISAQHRSTHDAIRGAGSNTIILFDFLGGGNPGTVGVNATYGRVNPSTYADMTNVGWDLHFYPWMVTNIVGNETTDMATLTRLVQADAANAQTVKSKNGTMPVLFGEFGPDEDSNYVYANAWQCCEAVGKSGYGFIAWCLTPGGQLGLVDNNFNPTPWGQHVAALIASVAPPKKAESPQGTHVTAGDSGGIVNSEGKTWTITTDGKVAVNGAPDITTGNVSSLLYTQHNVVQTNAKGEQYSKFVQSDTWKNITPTTPPLPPVVNPPPTGLTPAQIAEINSIIAALNVIEDRLAALTE